MKSRGFTLIELMVVISIIGLLSSVILATLNSAKYSANDARRFSDLRQMEKALDTYYADNGKYPDTKESGGAVRWSSMCSSTSGLTPSDENHIIGNYSGYPTPAFVGTYIPSVPQDPAWVSGVNNGNCYAYYSDGANYKFKDWTPSNTNKTNSRVSSFIDPFYINDPLHNPFSWAVWSSYAMGQQS